MQWYFYCDSQVTISCFWWFYKCKTHKYYACLLKQGYIWHWHSYCCRCMQVYIGPWIQCKNIYQDMFVYISAIYWFFTCLILDYYYVIMEWHHKLHSVIRLYYVRIVLRAYTKMCVEPNVNLQYGYKWSWDFVKDELGYSSIIW